MAGVREIVFDTETTGLDSQGNHRLTEIGCVELVDFLPTGRIYQTYLKPDDVKLSEKITEMTGLTTEFLADKPLFADVADEFCDFVGESPLVSHHAEFDRGFINAALTRADYDAYPRDRFIDTLTIARKQFPGAGNSLDALCKRFDISLASRTTHGALIDSQLLARVYLELRGGRERSLEFEKTGTAEVKTVTTTLLRQREKPLAPFSSEDERAAHAKFVRETLGSNAIWSKDRN